MRGYIDDRSLNTIDCYSAADILKFAEGGSLSIFCRITSKIRTADWVQGELARVISAENPADMA
jgi:hypothetical protein